MKKHLHHIRLRPTAADFFKAKSRAATGTATGFKNLRQRRRNREPSVGLAVCRCKQCPQAAKRNGLKYQSTPQHAVEVALS